MATVRKVIEVAATAADVWETLSDFGAVDKKVARGFVTACTLESPEVRVVTFANGTSARERLIECDDKARRLVYAVVGSPRLEHHSASVEVVPEGAGRVRVVWTADFLPNEIKPYIDGQMELGAQAMKAALSAQNAPAAKAG
jgi:carbon monoxide dehydrogenase subunit G